jgi:hypothetical protein
VLHFNRFVCVLLLNATLSGLQTLAQHTPNTPITADNVATLVSVQTIDFATAPAEAGELISGWLRVDATASRVVTVNRANDLLLWNLNTGDLEAVYTVPGSDGTNANMMDIAWNPDGTQVHSLHTDGGAFYIAVYTLDESELQIITVPSGDNRPVRVWASSDPAVTWVEVLTADPEADSTVLQLEVATGELLTELPSVAEADRESNVRIGRMPAPLAVTSSLEGTVQLWDLELGELLYRVQLDLMPTFGHINGASGRRLVWRDNASENLYLLDFETGENDLVTPLGGTYAQALLLTPSADVVLGVNLDLEPVVVAWDAATGERADLGEYRTCSRTPDMVQLSQDGTALVIGCDTGLDVWRIAPQGE